MLYALDNYFSGGTVEETIKLFIRGKYHLWYLNMIIGLYLITPLLRKITSDKKSCEYLLILSMIVSIVIPTVFDLFKFISIEFISDIVTHISVFIDKIDMSFGYVFYYILGYYLHKYKLNKNVENSFYF